MYYPEELVEEVRERNDIVDVIGGYVRLKRSGANYIGLCPFHNEKSPSSSVSGTKQMYYCFGCGAGGNVFTFLMEYENYSFVEALKALADRAGIQLPEREYSDEARRQADRKSRLLEVNKEAGRYYYYQLKNQIGILNRILLFLPKFGIFHLHIYNQYLQLNHQPLHRLRHYIKLQFLQQVIILKQQNYFLPQARL